MCQRVDVRLHVGVVEVVLFVKRGRWQNEIGVEGGGVHAGVDVHHQIQLAIPKAALYLRILFLCVVLLGFHRGAAGAVVGLVRADEG